ncbi:MAG: YdjY domain-containing protein [Zavarzinella sp.]
MRKFLFLAVLLFAAPDQAAAYIEAPHTLGKCVNDSSNIVLMEVTKINAEKNLIIFKKVADIKGKHPTNEIKHNIGKRGFNEREWKTIMAWAKVGEKAVFMYSGNASETCIGKYWYQCYQEGEWWGMSHAEPFLLRTYFGDAGVLGELCARIHKNEEVIVPCLQDTNKNDLHLAKGKVQRLKASLKKQDYNPKRDFVGWGDLGGAIIEYKDIPILKAGSSWKYREAGELNKTNQWTHAIFDDSKWQAGIAPIGYGEDEIGRRKGTTITAKGLPFLFRTEVMITAEQLATKNATMSLRVASDNHAVVYVNGELADKDTEADHEFVYWNRDVELPLKLFKEGKNQLAVLVENASGSSDLYFDLEIALQIAVTIQPKQPVAVVGKEGPMNQQPVAPEPKDPTALIIDEKTKAIFIKAIVAPRKLAHLNQVYPIEVVATLAHPRGQKAHETVVNFQGILPSELHNALVKLGLKPGKPALGEGQQATGPEVKIFLEIPTNNGVKRIPIEECLVHKATGKQVSGLKWHFTGSAIKQPDPEKDDKVYGADLSGTFLSLFPVTDSCVLQTQLTMKDEPNYKLEVNSNLLPKEGGSVKLVIQVP